MIAGGPGDTMLTEDQMAKGASMRAFWIAVFLVVAIAVLAAAGWRFFVGTMDPGMFGRIVGGLITAVVTACFDLASDQATSGAVQHGKCRFCLETG
jgi:hypothetical protein